MSAAWPTWGEFDEYSPPLHANDNVPAMDPVDARFTVRARLLLYATVITGCLAAAAALAQESPDPGGNPGSSGGGETAASEPSTAASPSESDGGDHDKCDWISPRDWLYCEAARRD